MCTSAAKSTSQQFCQRPSIARIFGCQLLISGANVSSLLLTDSAGVLAFFRFLFDLFGHIWRREYLARSLECKIQHQLVQWVVTPLSTYSFVVQVLLGVQQIFAARILIFALSLLLLLLISACLITRKMASARLVVSSFQLISIVKIKAAQFLPRWRSRLLCSVILMVFLDIHDLVFRRLRSLSKAIWQRLVQLMTLLQSNSFTTHVSKKILITLMGDICWNLFSNIVYISAALFSLSSGCRLLSTSFLISLVLFDRVVKKFFFFSLRADASMDGLRSSATKPSSMSVVLTDSRFGLGFPTITHQQLCCLSLLMVQVF